jgi:hypothetical protein
VLYNPDGVFQEKVQIPENARRKKNSKTMRPFLKNVVIHHGMAEWRRES